MIKVDEAFRAKDLDARIMLQVHDELMVNTPKRGHKRVMGVFKEAMEDCDLFDVAMLSDGKIGCRWGEMEACE